MSEFLKSALKAERLNQINLTWHIDIFPLTALALLTVFRALASANFSIVSVKSRLRSSSCSMLISTACLAFPASSSDYCQLWEAPLAGGIGHRHAQIDAQRNLDIWKCLRKIQRWHKLVHGKLCWFVHSHRFLSAHKCSKLYKLSHQCVFQVIWIRGNEILCFVLDLLNVQWRQLREKSECFTNIISTKWKIWYSQCCFQQPDLPPGLDCGRSMG